MQKCQKLLSYQTSLLHDDRSWQHSSNRGRLGNLRDVFRMNFDATKASVLNRGQPSDEFLTELVTWGKGEPVETFTANPNPRDIYAYISPILGPWEGLAHRRAAMLEAMRVHAGFESSWNWTEGVDTTNQHSVTHIEGQETGIFQVSYDSVFLGNDAMVPFAVVNGINTPGSFISTMKSNHTVAMQYYARLVRVSVQWAGPIIRHAIDPWLSKAAVAEFQNLLIS